MLDAGSQSDKLQRARGRAAVGFVLKSGVSKLATLHQSGCAKILIPASYDDTPQAVFINTSGGVTGGDKLFYAADAGAGSKIVLTTQAAERIYKASSGEGQIETRLTLGAGATLDWLPQETILFEGARLRRRLFVDMAGDASALLLEPLILGRKAMGETLDNVAMNDQWRVMRGGKLIYADALSLIAPVQQTTQGTATLNGARALATLVYIAPDAEARLDATRALLNFDAVEAAASAWNGHLVMRFLSADAQPLRKALITFLTQFRPRALPRVWLM